tara:strand:+ start:540 stop:1544 length:1005 start_codon:yes stop_codon:yes gene_type:complete
VPKVLILKNDRVGDYFTAIKSINLILNKHEDKNVEIFLSKINYRFNFIFKNLKVKIFNYDLNVIEKLKIILYILLNDISDIYILTPKNFYYYLPLLFKKIKFHAVCVESKKRRPSKFLKKYLFRNETLYRNNKSKVLSVYKVLENLINYKNGVKNYITLNFDKFNFLDLPKNTTFFHYKHNLFHDKLAWSNIEIKNFIQFLSSKRDFIVFSSELDNFEKNNFFFDNFNSFDFSTKKYNSINNNNILYLKNIEGKNLVNAIYLSKEVIAPESGITHIGSFLKKDTLALMNFNFSHKRDIFQQIIDCKEWAPLSYFKFTIIKKDYFKTINKLSKLL